MCELKDFSQLKLDREHRLILEAELEAWHHDYLPIGKTVLDIGAGNGETAQFYLNHGAERVICVDANAEMLHYNFGNNPKIMIIEATIDTIKSDCEGGERGLVIETHFPFYLKHCKSSAITNPSTNLWKFQPIPIFGRVTNFEGVKILRLLRIQIAHFIRRTFERVTGWHEKRRIWDWDT